MQCKDKTEEEYLVFHERFVKLLPVSKDRDPQEELLTTDRQKKKNLFFCKYFVKWKNCRRDLEKGPNKKMEKVLGAV